MSKATSINLPVRRVIRISSPGSKSTYQVFQIQENGSWEPAGKERPHSTTAFADLGRLTQKDTTTKFPILDGVDGPLK